MIIADVEEEELNISYKYCDGLIPCAFYAGYFRHILPQKQDAVLRAFSSFQNPNEFDGIVTLTKSCFIEFQSVIALFDYLGLGGCGNGAKWNLQRVVARKYGLCDTPDKKYSVEAYRSIIKNDFSDLLVWNGIEC